MMFAITEILLHLDLYRRQCSAREHLSSCFILILQMSGAACVLLHSCLFMIIYIHVTIVVLKQAHGTFNFSNAMNIPCQTK